MRKFFAISIMMTLAVLSLSSCSPDDPDNGGGKVEVLDNLITGAATNVTSFSATLNASVNNFNSMEVAKSNYGFVYVVTQDDAISSDAAQALFNEYEMNGYAEGCKFVNGGIIEVGGKYSYDLQNLIPESKLYYCAVFDNPKTKKTELGDIETIQLLDFSPSFKVVESKEIGFLNSVISIEADYCGATSKNVQLGLYYHTQEDQIAVNGTNIKYSNQLDSIVTIKIDYLKANTQYYVKPYIYDKKREEYHFGDIISFTTLSTDEMAVDMGLSVKWASCDLGAVSANDEGWWFNFASLQPRQIVGMGYYDEDYLLPAELPEDISGTEFDAATYYLGGKWRMPTVEEYNELINNSEIEIKEDVETELSIKLYRMLTWSKKNGAYLSFNRYKILRSTDNTITVSSVIRWLSSCHTITSQGQTIKYPNGFYVYNDGYDLDYFNYLIFGSIRPVCDY